MREPDVAQLTADLEARAGRGNRVPHVTEVLRLVWHTSGAADIEILWIDRVVHARMPAPACFTWNTHTT